MASVQGKRIIEAPVSEVWAAWDDFGEIQQFHPGLNASFLIEQSAPTGLGAKRQCNLSDGKTYLKEEIIGYAPEQQMIVDIYGTNAPIKKALATVNFRALGANRTEVTMHLDFIPKLGILGQLLVPMMKKQFSKTVERLLSGNAAFVEQGVRQAA